MQHWKKTDKQSLSQLKKRKSTVSLTDSVNPTAYTKLKATEQRKLYLDAYRYLEFKSQENKHLCCCKNSKYLKLSAYP